MAMVKAFAYGSGSFEVANLLQYNRVDYLAVAYADEGVDLRKRGITIPIMVMSPEPSAFEQMLKYNLEPEIYNFRILDSFRLFLEEKNIEHAGIHIKIDTGMRRLGFEENDVQGLIKALAGKGLVVRSVFSHLASAENPEHDDFTNHQLRLFEKICGMIRQGGHHFSMHIANTAGILRFPEGQYDMVRLGIGLYGIENTDQFREKLEHVGTLKTTVTQIKTLGSGETVGYSRKGVLHKDSEIATVKIGYADGLSRAFGNRKGYMTINGRKAEIVGSVCMDMCMLNVTGMNVREGDEVIVFGMDPTVERLAELAGTIPYEILTNVSQRVKRIYYYE
jgi:alanine racemase